MEFDSLRTKAIRAATDPAAAARWLKRQIRPASSATRKPANQIAATLEQRIAELAASLCQSIAIYADETSYAAVAEALGDRSLSWLSADFDSPDAKPLSHADARDFDAVLVAGPDAALLYRHAVRWLSSAGHEAPVYWVSESFEFCAGTLPVPSMCDDAEIDIFNHFSDFLGNRETLLVRVEVFDQANSVTRWVPLPPRKSLRVQLSEWLPERHGPACVFHHCAHPVLTRGRHYRWRATGQLHWQNSVTMVHGDGDFRGPGAHTEHKIGAAGMESGNVVFSVPNYHSDVPPEAASLDILERQDITTQPRNCHVRIDEVALERGNGTHTFDDFYGVRFAGYGGSFWYTLEDGKRDGAHPSIAANHSVRSALQPEDSREEATPDAGAFVSELRAQEILLDPHAVPVEPDESPIEFGFEFDANVPALRAFDAQAFGRDGKHVGQIRYNKENAGPVFAKELLTGANLDPAAIGLLLVSPDWIAAGADPRGRGATGNLVARLKHNRDFDVTEFQNSWRNVGRIVNELPHWLSQDRMLVGRTNVMCGISTSANTRVGISLANASGNLRYQTSADCIFKIIGLNGREVSAGATLPAFGCETFWLDDLFDDWRSLLPEEQGTVIVESADADLNANLVTVHDTRSVSLQHMWGY
jgi:hypothetical protein